MKLLIKDWLIPSYNVLISQYGYGWKQLTWFTVVLGSVPFLSLQSLDEMKFESHCADWGGMKSEKYITNTVYATLTAGSHSVCEGFG